LSEKWSFPRRDIRYQAAIVDNGRLLLIQYAPTGARPFWLLPGGGREDETEAQCVAREVFEETGLIVHVERLLFEVPTNDPQDTYEVCRTYLCSVIGGEAKPGIEAEAEAAFMGEIVAVRWFALGAQSLWPVDLLNDAITYPQIVKIGELLGYSR
jgi:8-oxo-dGTP pyrophosphatase MutT (NUDIX family)